MIVGTATVNMKELEKRARDKEAFLTYVDKLVPAEFKHIPAIIDNQRYVCCLMLRRSQQIPWSVKNELLDAIMPKLVVIGYTDVLVETHLLYNLVDMKRVEKFNRRGGR